MTRCAAESLDRGDDPAGTASTVRAFLLVEDAGPWGVAILRDSRLPAAVRAALGAVPGARPLLVRRSGRQSGSGVRVFAVAVGTEGGWVETALLDSVDDLLGLDLAPLAEGRSVGLEPHAEPLVLVCTHGRHDACCAERGRPVALALAEAGVDAWECSHIGGDRFAGNVLVLPDGLYYGRVEPEHAVGLVRGHAEGRLDLGHLRGRSNLPMPVQYAEVALRRRLSADGLLDVRPTGHRVAGDLAEARFDVPDGTATVRVRTTMEPAAPLTCSAVVASPVPRHEVVGLELAGAAR